MTVSCVSSPRPSPPAQRRPLTVRRRTAGSRLSWTRAIERSREYLLGLQYPEGYWWGELEANCSIHAEFVLLTHFLGIPDPKRWGKIVSYLKSKQLPDGGWPIWYGAPGDLSITTEAYFAMKLAGVDPNDPAMTKARRFILAQGGLPNVRIFTKMWLAMFGQWDWRDTPVLPAELVLLPSWFPFNIYEFASWARGTIVACTILLTLKPVCEVPEWAQLDELFPSGRDRTSSSYGKKGDLLSWNRLFRGVDKSLRLLEVIPVEPQFAGPLFAKQSSGSSTARKRTAPGEASSPLGSTPLWRSTPSATPSTIL